MEMEFVRNKITQLRLKKGISEAKMSSDLGHSNSYITHITSGRSNPSIQELLYIIDYFGITPSEFFKDESKEERILVQQINKDIQDLSDADLLILITFIQRMK